MPRKIVAYDPSKPRRGVRRQIQLIINGKKVRDDLIRREEFVVEHIAGKFGATVKFDNAKSQLFVTGIDDVEAFQTEIKTKFETELGQWWAARRTYVAKLSAMPKEVPPGE